MSDPAGTYDRDLPGKLQRTEWGEPGPHDARQSDELLIPAFKGPAKWLRNWDRGTNFFGKHQGQSAEVKAELRRGKRGKENEFRLEVWCHT